MGIDFTLSNLIDYSENKTYQKIMLEKSENSSFKEEDKIRYTLHLANHLMTKKLFKVILFFIL